MTLFIIININEEVSEISPNIRYPNLSPKNGSTNKDRNENNEKICHRCSSPLSLFSAPFLDLSSNNPWAAKRIEPITSLLIKKYGRNPTYRVEIYINDDINSENAIGLPVLEINTFNLYDRIEPILNTRAPSEAISSLNILA